MQRRFDRGAAFAALAAVLAMAVARAWHCDDAFISFRAVEQMALGHGPVFNAGERVQVFTHPLWFFALAAWSGLGASLHPGAMVLGLCVFAAGLLALFVAFRDRLLTLAVVLAAMFFSRTVVDYATSGLETPLGFALAMAAVAGLRTGRRALAVAALALLPLNRLDLIVWALPFAMAVPVASWRGRAAVLAAIAAPAAAWALFSTLYYGSPVPNTALAKLSGETLGRLDQGLSYLAASLLTDPGTLALVAGGVAVGVARWRSDRLVRAAAAALLLSLGYVVWAGGDFMLGRFMLPAAWAAIAVLLAGIPSPHTAIADRRWLAGFLGLLALAHAVSGHSTLHLQTVAFPKADAWGRDYHGALDERRFYLPWMGLFARTALREMPFVSFAPAPTDPEVTWAMGAHAYLRPRDHAIVDHFALAEPFLARIRPLPGGRPGHGFRPVPEAFWRWRDPTHVFGDARLDALAHDLRLAHRSVDLLSWERGAAILRLLRTRRIGIDAVHTHAQGEWMNIAIKTRLLDRRAVRTGRPVAWVSRDCEASAPRFADGYLVATDGEGVAHLRCPSHDFGKIPLWVAAGTIDPPAGNMPAFLDDRVPLVMKRWTWLAQVASWSVSGHAGAPGLALVAALLLAVLCILVVRTGAGPPPAPR